MDYNTKKKEVPIKEYGRNVHTLIEYAISVTDTKRKAGIVAIIIDFMKSVITERVRRDYNVTSDQDEATLIAWQHLAFISNGQLGLELPEGVEAENPEPFTHINSPLSYPQRKKHYMSYGRYAGEFLLKAAEFEDESKKQFLSESIGHYMQHSYNQWQSDSVSSEQIVHDIKTIMGGDFSVSETADFSEQNGGNNNHRRKKHNRNNNFKSNKNKKNFRRFKK